MMWGGGVLLLQMMLDVLGVMQVVVVAAVAAVIERHGLTRVMVGGKCVQMIEVMLRTGDRVGGSGGGCNGGGVLRIVVLVLVGVLLVIGAGVIERV